MKQFLIIICFALTLGCGKKEMAPSSVPAPEQEQPASSGQAQEKGTAPENTEISSPAKIALVYEKTVYKEKLINEMKTALEKKGLKITTALHSEKGVELTSPDEYSVIFITISGVQSVIRPWIQQWLKTNTVHSDKTILHVTQNHDWKVEAGVDTITGASKDDPKAKAAEYTEKILSLLKK